MSFKECVCVLSLKLVYTWPFIFIEWAEEFNLALKIISPPLRTPLINVNDKRKMCWKRHLIISKFHLIHKTYFLSQQNAKYLVNCWFFDRSTLVLLCRIITAIIYRKKNNIPNLSSIKKKKKSSIAPFVPFNFAFTHFLPSLTDPKIFKVVI